MGLSPPPALAAVPWTTHVASMRACCSRTSWNTHPAASEASVKTVTGRIFIPAAYSLYRRDQRLAREVGGEVVDDELSHRGARGVSGARGVRLEHDVLQREARLRDARLVGE